ncbi:dihydrodipicolinate synthase family protein [Amycolatopsis jejuensis]|uniref:dihydrodipicolinate synthase family protein n=1 Tax=Amycolatopsis jejuensis TaxID=330084 RepID=UPI000524CD7F|nr:dihydrodipicolinate synthase family protein [Amycolatopsis jejuensis]
MVIHLPDGIGEYRLGSPGCFLPPAAPFRSRIAYAAAHVVPDAAADNTPGAPPKLDWDRTLAFRHELWRWGFGVAEAMDTAQRGMGLDWPTAAELIRRSAAEARSAGARIAVGVGTDQVTDPSLPQVMAAYREQLAVAEDAGATPILMASRALAQVARSADDYAEVYDSLLAEVSRPVILHWLGDAFDPQLAGYWGSADLDDAAETVLSLISRHAKRIDGIKLSLLDADRERSLRQRLPAGVRMYTGDDFHYSELIEGDGTGYSDALLGVFAAIAPAASHALQALDNGDAATYRKVLAPTVPLARQLFAAPTYHYKTGIVFLAWLNGHQDHFGMVNGAQHGRSRAHLTEVFRLADQAGLLRDPELAVHRMQTFLAESATLRR